MTMRSSGARLRALTSVAVAMLVVLLPAAPAFAHGGDESDQSRVLVLQALSYLANQPEGFADMAAEKVMDALDATDQNGVDLPMIQQAQKQLESGDISGARKLLQDSVAPLTVRATGEETGTTLVSDPLPGATAWSPGAWLLAFAAIVLILVGVALAYRWRPQQSLSSLRAQMSGARSSSEVAS